MTFSPMRVIVAEFRVQYSAEELTEGLSDAFKDADWYDP